MLSVAWPHPPPPWGSSSRRYLLGILLNPSVPLLGRFVSAIPRGSLEGQPLGQVSAWSVHVSTSTPVSNYHKFDGINNRNLCSHSSGGQKSKIKITGLARWPGGGHGNPLQYFCLENPLDSRAWQATVHGVAKSWTRLNSTIQHRAGIKKDPAPARGSREEALACLFQRLMAAYTPWLVATHALLICLRGHVVVSSSVCHSSLLWGYLWLHLGPTWIIQGSFISKPLT